MSGERLTFAQTLAAAILVGAVGWFTATVVNAYRDGSVSQEVRRMRDRETDDLKARISALESRCRP